MAMQQGGPLTFHYPQNLWITLWTERLRDAPFRGQIAYLLPWSKNDQPFLPLFLNDL